MFNNYFKVLFTVICNKIYQYCVFNVPFCYQNCYMQDKTFNIWLFFIIKKAIIVFNSNIKVKTKKKRKNVSGYKNIDCKK